MVSKDPSNPNHAVILWLYETQVGLQQSPAQERLIEPHSCCREQRHPVENIAQAEGSLGGDCCWCRDWQSWNCSGLVQDPAPTPWMFKALPGIAPAQVRRERFPQQDGVWWQGGSLGELQPQGRAANWVCASWAHKEPVPGVQRKCLK